MAFDDITPGEATSLFDRLDSWYDRDHAEPSADDAEATE